MGKLADVINYAVYTGVGCTLIAGTIAGAIVFGIPGYIIGKNHGITHGMEARAAKVAELRLSERKTNTLSLDQREDIFVRQVVPTFGLKTGSLDYNVLRTACTTGVYGSNADDFKVPAERVKATYELCGWKIGQ